MKEQKEKLTYSDLARGNIVKAKNRIRIQPRKKVRVLSVAILLFVVFGIASVLGLISLSSNAEPGDLLFTLKAFNENRKRDTLGISTDRVNFEAKIIEDRINAYNIELENNNCVQAVYIEKNIIDITRSIFTDLKSSQDNVRLMELSAILKDEFSKIDSSESKCSINEAILGYSGVFTALEIRYSENAEATVLSEFQIYKADVERLRDRLKTEAFEDQESIEQVNNSFFDLLEIQDNADNYVTSEDFFAAYLQIDAGNKILRQINNILDLKDLESRSYQPEVSAICTLIPSASCLPEAQTGVWNSINDLDSDSKKILLGVDEFKSYLELLSI